MDAIKNKTRAKFTLAVLMLLAALPVEGNASIDTETQAASKVSDEDTVAMGETYRGMRSPAEAMEGSSSSYQGTTTGPGPNGGYPGTPRGSYDTNERAINR